MRVVLADNHRQALWALKTMLQEQPEVDVVGEATCSEELFTVVEKATADLLLIDRKLLGDAIEDLISALHALTNRPLVLVMSTNPDDKRPMMQAGADAFVSKADQPDRLLKTLRQYALRIKKAGGSK